MHNPVSVLFGSAPLALALYIQKKQD